MVNLLVLPDDIIFLVLRHFILSSKVEELIRLEIVCRRLRQLCLSHACWVDALETLDTRPPLITSRSSLLALNATDLRDEIIRAVRLDRSWMSDAGPTKTAEEVILVADSDGNVEELDRLLPLPEVDLIFASYRTHRIRCWSLSNNRLIWDYIPHHDADIFIPPAPLDLEFACDVLDDSFTVLVALLFLRDRVGETRFIEVYQIDTRSLDCKLVSEITLPGTNAASFHDVQLRDDYIISNIILNREENWYIFVNWKLRTFFQIKEKIYDDELRPRAITRDSLFFVLEEGTTQYRLVGIRYRTLRGTSSSVYDDWLSYNIEDLTNLGVYSHILLSFWDAGSFTLQAVVSSWLRNPTTHLTVTFHAISLPQNPGKTRIFNGTFKIGDDGQGVFAFELRESELRTDIIFATTPSVAMRALAHRGGDYGRSPKGPATCYIPFNRYDGDTLQERIHPLRLSHEHETHLYPFAMRMDILGRMVIYETASNHIAVARFDEPTRLTACRVNAEG